MRKPDVILQIAEKHIDELANMARELSDNASKYEGSRDIHRACHLAINALRAARDWMREAVDATVDDPFEPPDADDEAA